MTATPTPPPTEPAATTPSVPYGPGASEQAESAGGTPAGFTLDLSKRSVGGTAAKWGIRILLPNLIRALFRAIARR